jgi:hypothetical protein
LQPPGRVDLDRRGSASDQATRAAMLRPPACTWKAAHPGSGPDELMRAPEYQV